MSRPILKLTKGARTLDLNDQTKYFLGQDFFPPPVNLIPSFAEGSSSNRAGGATLISTRAVNRSLSFSVMVVGASVREMARAVNDIQYFLSQAGNAGEPVYLEYKASSSDITTKPLWGQDGWLIYQVEYGIASVGNEYAMLNRLATNLIAQLSLVIRPYALGIKQRLASATGGILEDTIGTVDGQSRGLIVPEAMTNKMTNPIFGHGTWNNGWTGLTLATQNTDVDFLLFGLNSAKLIYASGTSTWTQSINVGNTNTHTLSCYAKRPDGAAVTASDVSLYYGAGKTTSYESVGNGWYRLTATFAGINAATATGVTMVANRSVYVDGFQIEEKAYVTPLAYGDMLGCAWTSTAHASTSTRTVARTRVIDDDIFNPAQGCIRIVYKFTVGLATLTTQRLFTLDNSGTTFLAQYGSGAQILYRDGTTTLTPAISNPAEGAIDILHFVWGPSGIVVYRNGSSIASNATYTPVSGQTNLYIGSTEGVTTHGNGIFMDFTVFDRELSSTEVAADYSNIAQVTTGDQRVGSVPWLWSSDGDDDVVNHNDTDANDDNYIVCGGIPGSAPAVTFISGNTSTGWITDPTLYMWLMDTDKFLDPIELVNDLSGSADANSSGGEYYAAGVASSVANALNKSASPLLGFINAFAGREMANLVRLYDEGSGLTMATIHAAPIPIISDYKSFATAASFGLYLTPFVAVQDSPPGFIDYDLAPASFRPGISLLRSGASATFRIDYSMAVSRPFLTLTAPSGLGEAGFYYQGRRAATYDPTAAGSPYKYPLNLQGDIIEFSPNRYNTLLTLVGDATHNPTIATVVAYAKVVVTPRWSLL